MSDQHRRPEKARRQAGSPAQDDKTPPPGRWGVTRLPREKERRIYFVITLAMVAVWLLNKLWGA